MNKIAFIYPAILYLFLSSCIKDDDGICHITNELLCNARLSGYVVDKDKLPVPEAIVSLDGIITMTDQYGHFFFDNTTMNAHGTMVKVEKQAYLSGSRKFYPASGKESKVKIQIMDQNFDQSFNTSSGGIITVDNNVEIIFDANSIVSEDGNPYSGTVYVSSLYLDPTENATLDQMPGDLSAINQNNEPGILNSFGMVNVELQDENGNPLNIKEGETANIEMQIPESLLANAPTTIPLWYFDEVTGFWKEEGTAQLEGGKYKGTVNHFSWWNCDKFNNVVTIDLTLVNSQGIPLPNIQTQLSLVSSPTFTGNSFTNSNGYVKGLVPADEMILLDVKDNCDEIIFSQNIGPFNTNTYLDKITLAAATGNITLQGQLKDCDGKLLDNGFIHIDMNNNTLIEYVDHNPFSINISLCSNIDEILVKSINKNDFTESTAFTYSVASVVNVGQLTICNSLNNYFYYKYGNISEGIVYDASAEVGNSEIVILATETQPDPENNFDQDKFFKFAIPGIIPGTYNGTTVFTIDIPGIEQQKLTDFIILDHVGDVGEQISGSFNTIIINTNNTSVNYHGSFSVLRVD